jgi:hypothetical protein
MDSAKPPRGVSPKPDARRIRLAKAAMVKAGEQNRMKSVEPDAA